jgi:putative selenium metabolism protein SsnA
VEEADLIVADRRIGGDDEGATKIDCSGCLVLPGLCCAHHHLYSALARGMPAPPATPRSFRDILELVWWPLDRALTLEDIELSALYGAVQAARCGTTTIVDHHASYSVIEGSLDAVASGLEQAGLRGALCFEVSDRHGLAPARTAIAENLRFECSDRGPLLRAMMGAHASFTISPETMASLTSSARDAAIPLHIHVAEDQLDENDSLDRFGVRTLERLQREGALEEGDLIAHGVHLDENELITLRASGTWAAHNPRSNLNNAVGYAPAASFGVRACLGTDGIDGDLLAEARTCYLQARAAGVSDAAGFSMGRLQSSSALAGALFSEPAMGRLEVGAPADLVVLDYRSPSPLESSNLAGHVLFGLSSADVRDVMVDGRFVVRERAHQSIDEEELASRCRTAAPALWERAAAMLT